MHLLAPAYLWFLGAALIPPIIYLIFRRRKQDVPWGAVYILKRLLESKAKHNIWLQYLVIFLRSIAVAAVACVFIQAHRAWQPPVGGAFPSAPASTHRIVLLDLSKGMSIRHEGGTAADAAMSLCRKLIASGSFPGLVEIIPMGGGAGDKGARLAFSSFPPDEAQAAAALARLGVGDAPCDIGAGMRAAMESFRSHGEYQRRELYLLSDFSASKFPAHEGLQGNKRALQALGAKIYGIEYRKEGAANFAILDLSCGADLLLSGQPALFNARVAYYGAGASADTKLAISDGKGSILYEADLSLAPGEQDVQLPLALPPGEQAIVASLREDALQFDNSLKRSYRVAEEMRVALVQNILLKRGFDNPREWLNLALSNAKENADGASTPKPQSGEEAIAKAASESRDQATGAKLAASGQKRGRIILEGRIPEQLSSDNLTEADAVIVLDVESLDQEKVETLRLYMARGGTVLLAPGATAKAERFNQSYASIAPLAIAPPVQTEIDPARYESCLAEKLDNPLVRELDAPQHGNIGNARFYNHYGWDENSLRDDSTLLLSLSDGAPLLAERPIGRGRCLLWTAGLGSEWHSLVVHPGYPVFLTRMLTQAAAGRKFALNLRVGEPIIRQVQVPKARVIRPNGEKVDIDTVQQGETSYLRYDHTDQPGDYTVLAGTDDLAPASYYHVVGKGGEGDIRPLAPAPREAVAALFDGGIADSEAKLSALAGSQYDGQALGLAAALLAVACLMLQSWISRRFLS